MRLRLRCVIVVGNAVSAKVFKGLSLKDVVAQIDEFARQGEVLAAYDAVMHALKKAPDDLYLKHRAVLYLARAGALERAQSEYFRLCLNSVENDEDVIALGGRLLKSMAMETRGEAHQRLAAAAAEKYLSAYQQSSGFFSGINTASLYLIAGRGQKSRSIARRVLAGLDKLPSASGQDGYYQEATRAEAYFLLNLPAKALEALRQAVDRDPKNYVAHAATLRQLFMIHEVLDLDSSLLEGFRPPKSAHFVGHIYSVGEGPQSLDAEAARALERSVRTAIQNEDIGFGFAALAAGADIVIAEALIESGAEVHVVQPCSNDIFVQTSVAPFGEQWVRRFEACMDNAATVRYVAGNHRDIDKFDIAFASEVAMGLAALRSQTLFSEAVQFAVWDDSTASKSYGTSQDVRLWRNTGRRQIIVPFPQEQLQRSRKAEKGAEPDPSKSQRALLAMIFADVQGYGELSTDQIVDFLEYVLNPLADCYAALASAPRYVNTWGDGLFLAFDKVGFAAKAALALQEKFRSIDLSALGLPEHLALRIGAHFGPVHERTDPFTGRQNIFGTEVIIASRIESVTVPGSVHVSEPFACAIATHHPREYGCDYLGQIELGKTENARALFSLRPTSSVEIAHSSR